MLLEFVVNLTEFVICTWNGRFVVCLLELCRSIIVVCLDLSSFNIMPQSTEQFRAAFGSRLRDIEEKKGRTSGFLSKVKYNFLLLLGELLADSTIKRTSQDYRITARYVVSEVNVQGAVKKYLKHRGTNKLYLTVDEIFDIIHTEHLSTGHGARDITNNKIKESYANITKEVIQMYVDMCETCSLKKRKIRKSLTVKPILSNAMNSRCQVDLVDMQSQPDGEYKWIMVYQDHLTKFVVVSTLMTPI